MEKDLKSRILKYTITSIVFALICAYLIYHMVAGASDSIVTEIAYPISDEISLDCDAYVIRNEKIIKSDSPGMSATYYYDDGARVSKNSRVASLFYDESESRGRTMIDIDKKIDFLENSNIDKTYMTSDTSGVDAKLNDIYYAIRTSLEDGKINSVLSSSEDLLTLLNRRMVITGEVAGFDKQIEQLQSERQKYSRSIGVDTTSVYTDLSGYFYSNCDGYENIFNIANIQNISYDGFMDYTLKSPENDDGYSIGKIAYDYSWQLVCPVTKTDLKNYSIGKSYEIVFTNNANKRLKLKLIETIPDTDSDGALMVFESFDCPGDFAFTRMQQVKIIESSVSGIKVPSGALRVVDGETGVYILYGSKVYFCKLNIIAQKENYYIASVPDLQETPYGVLCIYDNIIVSGKDLYEGKVIS